MDFGIKCLKIDCLERKSLTSIPEYVKINNCKLLSYGYKGYFE